jgi:hypothetical protein
VRRPETKRKIGDFFRFEAKKYISETTAPTIFDTPRPQLTKFLDEKQRSNNIFSNYLRRRFKEAACLPLPCFQHAWQQLTKTRHLRKEKVSINFQAQR